MSRKCLGAVILAALCWATPALADEDTQAWTTLNVTAKLGDHWRAQEELVGRFSDKRDGLYEIESNTMLGYALDKQITAWIGYTHDPQYANGGHFTIMEHRAREQVTFDKIATVFGGSLSLRMRAEQRWREGLDGTGWRLRPYAKLAFPIANGGKTQLNLWHESFINLDTTSFQKQAGYERMRNQISVSTPLGKKVGFELGYLNQHGFVRHGRDTSDNVGTVALNFSF